MSWTKWRVTVTRLVEEEAVIYVNAPTEEEACDKAVDEASEIADAIWTRSDCEPHTFGVDKCVDAATLKKEPVNE